MTTELAARVDGSPPPEPRAPAPHAGGERSESPAPEEPAARPAGRGLNLDLLLASVDLEAFASTIPLISGDLHAPGGPAPAAEPGAGAAAALGGSPGSGDVPGAESERPDPAQSALGAPGTPRGGPAAPSRVVMLQHRGAVISGAVPAEARPGAIATSLTATNLSASGPAAAELELVRPQTVDVVLDHIEPVRTADLASTRDLLSSDPSTARRPEGELIVVDRILGSVEIVLDADGLLEGDSSLPRVSGDGTTDTLEPVRPAPAERVHPKPPAPAPGDLPEARFERALVLLDEGKVEAAHEVFEALSRAQPSNTEWWAAAGYTRFRLATDDRTRTNEAARLADQAQSYPYCAVTQRLTGRMFLDLARPRTAARHLRAAVELEPDRPETLALLRHANELIEQAQLERTAGGAAETPAGAAPPRAGLSPTKLRRLDRALVPSAAFGALLVIAVLHVLTTRLGLGAHERWIDVADAFVWGRPLLLGAVALIGARLFASHRPIAPTELQLAPRVFLFAIIAGALIGTNSPVHVVKVPAVALMAVALARTAGEELFFRVFVGRALNNGLVGTATPALTSAALYTLYVFTFQAEWSEASSAAALLPVVLRGLAAGLTYALIHLKTGSLVAPFFAHLTAAIIVAVGSAS